MTGAFTPLGLISQLSFGVKAGAAMNEPRTAAPNKLWTGSFGCFAI